jgi:non-ribosomal peptide synthetase component F
MEYICPLSWGATIVCVDDAERLDCRSLFQIVQTHQVEAMFFPTSLWELYAKEDWGGLKSVAVVAVGGDVLSFGGPPKLGGAFRVINMYGE